MITAKIAENGQLVTTHHIPQKVWSEMQQAYIVLPVEVPEGEVEVTLPEDAVSLHFIDCWTLDGGEVVVDLTRAKAQRAAFIVQLVDQALAALDARTARAVRDAITTGDNSRVTELETAASALRSLRSNTGVDSLATVEEVAAYLPEVLR